MSQVVVPDIGDFKEVEVIEVLVKPGDAVSKEQSLVTLESDKATMEIPSPSAGVVKKLEIKVGDKVSKGSPILVLEDKGNGEAPPEPKAEKKAEPEKKPEPVKAGALTVPVPDIVDDAIEEALRQRIDLDVVFEPDAAETINGLAALLRFR